MPTPALQAALSLRRGDGARVSAERMMLLSAIGDLGSISAAARRTGLSYKAAWDAVQALNNLFEAPLVAAQPGGSKGGAAALTEQGRAVLTAFRQVETELAQTLNRLDAGDMSGLFWTLGMRTSARNALRGVITAVTDGAVNSEVSLAVADEVEIVAVITGESVAELGLAVGKPAIALIKSSFVLLAKGEGIRTSARNQIAGRVARREDGAVSSEIVLEIATGKTLVASITRESAESLEISVGDPMTALIKAPHVILAVE